MMDSTDRRDSYTYVSLHDHDRVVAEAVKLIDGWRQQAIDRTDDWRKCEVERNALAARLASVEKELTALRSTLAESAEALAYAHAVVLNHAPLQATVAQRDAVSNHAAQLRALAAMAEKNT